jgi:2-polyprenyl-3-methyl-5-hydroxy-6-metoxy-1,4-benzoquinol methylase
MPSSYPHNIPAIVGTMLRLQPRSLLDVGPGYGKYGFMAREYLDDFRGDMRIEAVEVFPDYLERVGWSPYDRVHHGSLVDVELPDRYDLVLMIDVLEHFDRADGYDALYRALSAGDAVLVSTPIGYEQGPSHGNVHETHLSEWHPDDLTSHGMTWEDVASDELSFTGLVRW